MAVGIAMAGGTVVYGAVKLVMPLRLTAEEEFDGADLSIHQITATPESDW
jgi:Amt family ammonium transporter